MKQIRDGPMPISKTEIPKLKRLYQKYVNYVYTICLRLLSNVKAAEDATVETFVRLGRETARNCCELKLRERVRDLAVKASLKKISACSAMTKLTSLAAQQPVESTIQPDDKQADDTDNYSLLAEQLPNPMRIALALRDREGLSDYAIAVHLKISESEARQLLHQARMEMRRLWLNTK